MAKFKLSRSSKKNIEGVDKRIITLIERSLKKSPHDFGIPKYGGYRTPQEQNNLFHKKPKVTNLDGFKNKSYHQSGFAVDIFCLDEGKACWNECEYKYTEVSNVIKDEFELMKSEGIFKENEFLEWGGDWKRFKDLPHFQIIFENM